MVIKLMILVIKNTNKNYLLNKRNHITKDLYIYKIIIFFYEAINV